MTTMIDRLMAYSFIFLMLALFCKFPWVYATFGPKKVKKIKGWVKKLDILSAFFGWTGAVLFALAFSGNNSLSPDEQTNLGKITERGWLQFIVLFLFVMLFISFIRFGPTLCFDSKNGGGGSGGGGGGSGPNNGPVVPIGSGAYDAGINFMKGIEKGDPANWWKYPKKGRN